MCSDSRSSHRTWPASTRSTTDPTWHGPPTISREFHPLLGPRASFYPRSGFPSVVRPKYELPGNLRPASLAERRRFYAEKMDYRAAATWMARPTGGRVYALILGRHSGIYPPRFRHLKNVPLIIEDAVQLTRKERVTMAREFARRYAIDEWVTSGEMRLIRLPYSLHGMVSRVVIPVPRGKLESFRYDDPRAIPRP